MVAHGRFDLELPRWLIITILSVTTLPAALVGLWEALKRTGELASIPFGRAVLESIKRRFEKRYTHVIDEHGNKIRVVNEETDILGEKHIETEDGKHYRGYGGDEVQEM